jgi:hypothetical protein
MPRSSTGAGERPAISSADEDPLREPAVRELEPRDDVSHRIHVGHVGPEPLVGRHEAALDGDAGLLVAKALGRRAAADGDQQQVGLDRLAVFELDRDDVTLLPCAGEPDAGAEDDAALAERSLQLVRDGLVLGRDQARKRLDDGHFGTERTEHRSELDADDPRRRGHHPGRHVVYGQHLVARHDPATDLQARQRLRVRAGRQHDVAAGDPTAVDLHAFGSHHPPRAWTNSIDCADTRPWRPL